MLVSCIMPTADRRELVPLALKCFARQDWLDRELIVLDDGDDCVENLCRDIPLVRYFRHSKFATLGEKVNYCCALAQGSVIATWDDDDWSDSFRLADEVTRLEATGAMLTGYNSVLFYDGKRASEFRSSVENYPTGNSQVYRRSFWQSFPHPHVNVGYDGVLWHAARDSVVAVHSRGLLVARIHGKNVSEPHLHAGSGAWPFVDVSELPREFLEDIACRQER